MAKDKNTAPPKPSVKPAAPEVATDRLSPSSAPSTAPEAVAGPATVTRPATRETSAAGVADQLEGAVTGAARVVHTVLPNRIPAYLGAGALLLVGVIDPPVALAGGLTYEALRRWKPSR